jgi:hypothetical protein
MTRSRWTEARLQTLAVVTAIRAVVGSIIPWLPSQIAEILSWLLSQIPETASERPSPRLAKPLPRARAGLSTKRQRQPVACADASS